MAERAWKENDPLSWLPDRLVSKFQKTDDCWIWQAGTTLGYGYYWHNKKVTTAHRVVYEALVGEIPKGLQIDHLCRNRACVNPLHLEPVTQAENVKRGASGLYEKVRTECWRGHEFTPENTRITSQGSRQCKECVRINKAKREGRVHESA